MACWPLASAVASLAAACWAIFASDWARLSWMCSPSYCSLSALIWNSSCLACATSSVRVGFGAVVWAMLSAAGTSRASAVVAAARQAAPLSLRTAMHHIGPGAGCSTDSGNFSAGPPAPSPVPPVQWLPWPAAAAAILRRRGSGYPAPPRQRLSCTAVAAAIVDLAMAYTMRPARTRDVPMIRKLIDSNVESGRLLSKATVTLYEDVQEFCVAELVDDASLAGCGALHVMWEDLAEIRTVAVVPDRQGLGIGHAIVGELLARARVLGVRRVFCLTFAVDFFARHGFQPISGTPVAAEVYSELLRSYDEGVAEFLDLERVKPNTLGNTRMLLRLLPER